MARKPPKSPEQRLARWSRSMAPGTMNGRVASATPMALDRTQLAPRMRAQPVIPATGGFDPNEDPVIIGNGATAGGGSTPSDVSGGFTGAVVLGNAQVGDINAVAAGEAANAYGARAVSIGEASSADSAGVSIGYNSGAGGDAVAVGEAAVAASTRDVAVGNQSATDASHDNQLAVGPSASVIGYQSSAFGAYSSAHHLHATAVGTNSTTTKDHQIMLGSGSEFVEIPGSSSSNGLVLHDTSTGTRYLIQITSGALVLNTAP